MISKFRILLVALLAACLPALMAPSGGGITQTTGTFTFAYSSGCTSGSATASGTYVRTGKLMYMHVTAATVACTTTAATIVFTGLPVLPATSHAVFTSVIVNGTSTLGYFTIGTSGTVSINSQTVANFSGTSNGISPIDFQYSLN